jgi:glycosyltransferase involved in cell wall biosynthesis
MKYILLISNLKYGGAQKVVSLLSNSLIKNGHQTLVVTFNSGEINFPVANVTQMDLVATGSILNRFLLFSKRFIYLRKVKRKFKPDVSIGFLSSSNLLNVITRHKSETVISTVLGSIKLDDNNIYTYILNKFTYSLSDFVVAVSKGIMYQLEKRYSGIDHKLRVIYGYTSTLDKNIMAREEVKHHRLITVGRLEPEKSQWHLIYAVKALSNKYPDISLVILGGGAIESELLKLIDKLGLNNNVFLKGFHSDVKHFFLESDIFCLSSTHEGFSLVIVEAMNLALPIISTDIPHGPSEILNPSSINIYTLDHIINNEKFGLLVEYKQNVNHSSINYYEESVVNQFVEKISLLIESPSIYSHYSEQSLIRSKDFTEENIIREWTKLVK